MRWKDIKERLTNDTLLELFEKADNKLKLLDNDNYNLISESNEAILEIVFNRKMEALNDNKGMIGLTTLNYKYAPNKLSSEDNLQGLYNKKIQDLELERRELAKEVSKAYKEVKLCSIKKALYSEFINGWTVQKKALIMKNSVNLYDEPDFVNEMCNQFAVDLDTVCNNILNILNKSEESLKEWAAWEADFFSTINQPCKDAFEEIESLSKQFDEFKYHRNALNEEIELLKQNASNDYSKQSGVTLKASIVHENNDVSLGGEDMSDIGYSAGCTIL